MEKLLADIQTVLQYYPGPWQTIHGKVFSRHKNDLEDQVTVLDVRSWGYLTGNGHGGLALPRDETARIQDALGRVVGTLPILAATFAQVIECWLPIETAPLDGSRVLLTVEDIGRSHRRRTISAYYAEGRWRGDGMTTHWWPVAWQPLPAPLIDKSRENADAPSVG